MELPNQAMDWTKVARLALLSRQMDTLEVGELTPQGKVKYQFSAGGHELAQVLLAQALDHPHDAAAAYYRSRPFLFSAGLTPAEALAAGMAKQDSPSQGRDVGVVFNLPSRGGVTVLPASGDVGAQYTPAAGWAQAITYYRQELHQPDWEGAIAVAMGGDGSVAANGFWAALNIATTQQLPLLFFIEDNAYGLSVPATLQTPGGDIAANLRSFGGLKVMEADGWQPEIAWEAISAAVDHVRQGAGPCLLRVRVPRLAGHTFIDDQAYKSPELRAEEARHDPLAHLQAYLEENGFAAGDWQALEEEVRQELAAALEAALASPEPAVEQSTRYLFFTGEVPVLGGLRAEGITFPEGDPQPHPAGPRINFIDAVRRTLECEMQRNPRILVFGEDVGVKGGVHGATQDMQAHFGERRVFDTSLSEDGIVGRAAGMALAGLLPVPEIQFRKYADPAHEQISDLGTLRWRTANHFAAPVVVRIPVGFSKKTGDPWHSVTSESVFAHLPGWRIAFPSNAEDAVGLLRSALQGDDPTFFFEHRNLLDTPEGRRPYPGDDYTLPFGRAAHLTQGDAVTLIAWGAMVPRCLDAARDFADQVDLLDLRTIIPWDREAVLESASRTGKVLIVQEDILTAGFASEIAAAIAGDCFTSLDAPVRRMGMADIPVPFNVNVMNALLPGVSSIRAQIASLLAF